MRKKRKQFKPLLATLLIMSLSAFIACNKFEVKEAYKSNGNHVNGAGGGATGENSVIDLRTNLLNAGDVNSNFSDMLLKVNSSWSSFINPGSLVPTTVQLNLDNIIASNRDANAAPELVINAHIPGIASPIQFYGNQVANDAFSDTRFDSGGKLTDFSFYYNYQQENIQIEVIGRLLQATQGSGLSATDLYRVSISINPIRLGQNNGSFASVLLFLETTTSAAIPLGSMILNGVNQ